MLTCRNRCCGNVSDVCAMFCVTVCYGDTVLACICCHNANTSKFDEVKQDQQKEMRWQKIEMTRKGKWNKNKTSTKRVVISLLYWNWLTFVVHSVFFLCLFKGINAEMWHTNGEKPKTKKEITTKKFANLLFFLLFSIFLIVRLFLLFHTIQWNFLPVSASFKIDREKNHIHFRI